MVVRIEYVGTYPALALWQVSEVFRWRLHPCIRDEYAPPILTTCTEAAGASGNEPFSPQSCMNYIQSSQLQYTTDGGSNFRSWLSNMLF